MIKILTLLLAFSGNLYASNFDEYCSKIPARSNLSAKYAPSPRFSTDNMSNLQKNNIEYPTFVNRSSKPLGVTKANWFFDTTQEMTFANYGGMYCGKVTVSGSVGFDSIDVILGSEINTEVCKNGVIEHEMKHFRFYNNFLAENLYKINNAVNTMVANKVFYGTSRQDVESKITSFMKNEISNKITDIVSVSHKSQTHIDSQDEYMRVNLSCQMAGEKIYNH